MKSILLIILILLTSCNEYQFGDLKFEIEKLDFSSGTRYKKIELTPAAESELIGFINKYKKLDNRDRGHVMPHYNINIYTNNGKFLEKVRIFKWKDDKNRHISEEDSKLRFFHVCCKKHLT